MPKLSDTLLSEQIRTIGRSSLHGVLDVSHDDVTKSIFFRAGRIVFASSTLESDRLGQHLIRLGRISRDQFALAYQVSRDRREHLGETLVDAGLVDAEELGRLVAHQVQKIVLSVFTWSEGDLQFDEATHPIHEDLFVELSTHRLLFEGSRLLPDVSRIERALGDPARTLYVAVRPPFDVDRVALTPPERSILALVAQGATIAEILAAPGSRPLLIRGLYSLLAGGILEDARPPSQAPAPTVEEDTRTFRLALPNTPPAREEVDLAQRILQHFEALPRATHYAVLDVAPDAEPAAIDAAYRRLTSEQEREWNQVMGDVRMGSIIQTLRERRKEAYLVLSDPNQRVAYDRSLANARQRPGAPNRIDTAEAHAKAMTCLREAKALIERGERDAAVALLLQAIDHDPKDKSCRRTLALALAQHPTLARNAERHFLTALEIDPRDVDLRFRLALYYKKMGLETRALTQLRSVLAAMPDHEQARAELRALEQGAKRRR
jgi:tetratricopeptide (TPR) repeat protein